MRHSLVGVVVAVFAFATSAFAENYICVPDMATGFSYDKDQKTWETGRFKVSEKFVVRRATAEDRKENAGAVWVVTKTGSTYLVSTCDSDFTSWGYLYCRGVEDFRMNKKNLRFMAIYPIGYVNDGLEIGKQVRLEGRDTPVMQIGTCSTF